MGKQSRRWQGALAAGVLFMAVGCGDDSDDSDDVESRGSDEEVPTEEDANGQAAEEDDVDREPVLLDGGDTDTVDLPGDYEVGQTARSEIVVSMDVDGGAESVDLTMTMEVESEVTDVSDDGGFTITQTFDSVEVDSSDEAVQSQVEPEMNDLAGVDIVSEYDQYGVPMGEPTREDGELLPESYEHPEVAVFPEEAIGVGGSWTVEADLNQQGLAFDVVNEYELVDLTEDTYTLDLTSDTSFDEALGGGTLEGSMIMDGTMEGNRDNPLDVEMETDMTIQMDVTEGDLQESVSMVTTVEMTTL